MLELIFNHCVAVILPKDKLAVILLKRQAGCDWEDCLHAWILFQLHSLAQYSTVEATNLQL
jgi:hypothetical protein